MLFHNGISVIIVAVILWATGGLITDIEALYRKENLLQIITKNVTNTACVDGKLLSI